MGLAWRGIHGEEKVYFSCSQIMHGVFQERLFLIIAYGCFLNTTSDYYHLKRQIESELVDGGDSRFSKSFIDLPKTEQQLKLKERLKKYCQKVYFLDHF